MAFSSRSSSRIGRPRMMSRTRRPARSARATGTRRSSPTSPRGLIVLASLAASLTLVGGVLWLTGGNRGSAPGDAPALLATDKTSREGLAPASASTLDAVLAIPQGVREGRWQAIVIHDSGELVGSPKSMDDRARGMGLKGLGYHFVVGNGSGMPDGQVYVGTRWLDQGSGAHTAGEQGDWFNQNAIGVCLVGDGNRGRFTAGQTASTIELVRTLASRLGIPASRVYLHSQLAPTTSPGRFFPEAQLRAALSR